MQTTIREPVEFSGKGLHNGIISRMKILPAAANHGIAFVRVDKKHMNNLIPARVEFVKDTNLCTRIANKAGVSVSTIEHLMAGIVGCGIHNARIEVDSDELPGLDGSAKTHAEKLLSAGVKELNQPIQVIKILKPVSVKIKDATASLFPSKQAEMDFKINFPNPIGRQKWSTNLCNGSIVKNFVHCRTFVLESQIPELQKNGFGLGGNPDNVLIADVKNNRFKKKPRHKDEPCGHKMLDAVGDLSLAGYPIIGKFKGNKSGHRTTVELLKKLFADKGAYSIVIADSKTASTLPGVGAQFDDIPVCD